VLCIFLFKSFNFIFLFPLQEKYPIKKVLVCTYQAISGAGKTFETWPEMIDNVIPFDFTAIKPRFVPSLFLCAGIMLICSALSSGTTIGINVVCLAASSRSAGKTYEEAVGKKWCMDTPIPENMKNIVVI